MSRQRLPLLLIVGLCFTQLTCYSQFTNQTDLWNKVRGNVSSYSTQHYRILHKGDSAIRRLDLSDSMVFNQKSQLVKSFRIYKAYRSDSLERWRSVSTYNTEGNIKEILYYVNDKIVGKDVFYYSAGKKPLVMKRYYAAGRVLRSEDRYNIDAKGRILEQHHNNESDVPDTSYQLSKTRYKYNNKGLRTEEELYDLGGMLKLKRFIKYNEYGYVSEIADSVINPNALNQVFTFTYPKYDKQNNWLIYNRYDNGRLQGVTEREITYHK